MSLLVGLVVPIPMLPVDASMFEVADSPQTLLIAVAVFAGIIVIIAVIQRGKIRALETERKNQSPIREAIPNN